MYGFAIKGDAQRLLQSRSRASDDAGAQSLCAGGGAQNLFQSRSPSVVARSYRHVEAHVTHNAFFILSQAVHKVFSNQDFHPSSPVAIAMSRPKLEGKVAIITGGASGIGEATARLFASQGAFVISADIQDDLGRAVADCIGPDRCAYRHCDVRDEKEVEATVEFAVRTRGRLDVLFSNAGKIAPQGALLDASLEEWDDIMAVNARGAAAAVKHAARAMVARGTRGSIICTASVVASRGGTGGAAYTASKHAVLGLVRAAAAELGEHGIRVNCVSPSAVATPLACGLHGWSPREVEEYGVAVSRLKGVVLKASHVAEAALFLASDESEFITGHDLVVDGGRTIVGQSLPDFSRK